MANNCVTCGAVGATCCETAKARLETANSLSRIVDRQGQQITRLERERDEALQVLKDLRSKAVA